MPPVRPHSPIRRQSELVLPTLLAPRIFRVVLQLPAA